MESKKFNKDREFGVILEKIHSEIKVIGEGQNVLKEKLDGTMEMVAKNTEDITMMQIDIRVIKKDIAEIKEDLKSNDKRLTHLETAVK